MDYFIRKLNNKVYQIAKFEETKEPTELYTVTENLSNGYFHCNCMGFRRNQSQDHKHVIMAMYHKEHGYNHFSDSLDGKKLEWGVE